MNWREWLLKLCSPVVKWIGKLHWPFTKKKITGKHYYKWRDLIHPGCVLMTSTKGEFSNIINPLKIKHAAIYLGYVWNEEFKAEIPSVAEAVGRGVVTTDLVTFLTTKDYVICLTPKFKINQKALMSKLEHVLGLPYDYLFNGSTKSFYCYELVAYLIQTSHVGINLNLNNYLGQNVYDQNSFLESPDFATVFSNFT